MNLLLEAYCNLNENTTNFFVLAITIQAKTNTLHNLQKLHSTWWIFCGTNASQ
jgi:hypothetical protein